ncbi:MAG: dTDP-4-dehydrorhamnose reductase [Bacteroidales bacterium]|nr:dTDP-4-dehydrorhamnose reductase [Bacteroidales bacterium]
MSSILVTGANGQLGSSIRQKASHYKQHTFQFVDIGELDLTHEQAVHDFLSSRQIHYIINCAAYTSVDKAESQPDQAFTVNAGVPALLGSLCTHRECHIIHISTDYVYNGDSFAPHTEDERTLPMSVYAQSKLDGEKALWDNPRAIVLRTSWLYSEYGNNFMKTMLRLSAEKEELGVVYDQTGTPTYAGDLADCILQIIEFSEQQSFIPGVFNFSDEGVCSWYDFAVEIMKLAGSACRIKPIRTGEYPLPAKRPAYSVLDKQKIKNNFGISIPYWKDSLNCAFKNLMKGSSAE